MPRSFYRLWRWYRSLRPKHEPSVRPSLQKVRAVEETAPSPRASGDRRTRHLRALPRHSVSLPLGSPVWVCRRTAPNLRSGDDIAPFDLFPSPRAALFRHHPQDPCVEPPTGTRMAPRGTRPRRRPSRPFGACGARQCGRPRRHLRNDAQVRQAPRSLYDPRRPDGLTRGVAWASRNSSPRAVRPQTRAIHSVMGAENRLADVHGFSDLALRGPADLAPRGLG